MESNINRSGEVMDNLKKAHNGKSDIAYAYAFGYAWALLTETERTVLLTMAEKKATEKEKN